MALKTEEILDMIDDCIKRSNKLSEWEQDFIQGIDEQDTISDKQKEKLDAIWERIT
jgi:hypothetical protein